MDVGIVGLGLIGGSLGLELRSQGYRVLGVSRRTETCERAIAKGIADRTSTTFDVLSAAQLIFLCPPLDALRPTVEALIPHLNPEVILTDVGSVKAPIVAAIAPLWPRFVGGHPMAGTAAQGIEAAQSGLFRNAPYVLTPTETTPPDCLATVAEVVRSLGSQIFTCSPHQHDQAVAWISHLPVFVSAALIASCEAEADPAIKALAQQFASSGFRDTSRVGGGNPELGMMMAQYNQQAVLRSLLTYRATLDTLIEQLQHQNWQALDRQLHDTARDRPPYVAQPVAPSPDSPP